MAQPASRLIRLDKLLSNLGHTSRAAVKVFSRVGQLAPVTLLNNLSAAFHLQEQCYSK